MECFHFDPCAPKPIADRQIMSILWPKAEADVRADVESKTVNRRRSRGSSIGQRLTGVFFTGKYFIFLIEQTTTKYRLDSHFIRMI